MTLWFPTLPGPLVYIQDFIVGHWPEGDEDAMRRAAGHWSDMAEKLKGLQEPADQAMNSALSAIDGQIHDAMSSYWKDIGGDDGELKQLIDACDSFARQLEEGATDIEHTKISIYISVGIMVAMLLWSWIPGVGQAEEAGTIVAGKAAIQAAFRKLLSKLGIDAAKFMEKRGAKLLVNAGVGSTLGAGTDLAAQGIQIAEGTRKNMDWKSVGLSTLSGALAGTVAGPVGEKLGEGVAAAAAKADITSVTSNVGRAVTAKASEVVGNVVGNAVAGTTTSVVTGQHVDLTNVWEGGGGGLGNKVGVHPNAEVGTHETTTTPDTTKTTEPANSAPAQSNPTPSHTPSTPSESNTTPSSVTHSDAPVESTSPASTATASVATADTPSAPESTRAAGSENSAASQSDSVNASSGADARSSGPDPQPQTSGTNGGVSASGDRGIAGQAATAPGSVPDRSAASSPGSVSPTSPAAPSSTGATPAGSVPTGTPRAASDAPQRTDAATRPDAPTPPTSSTATSARALDGPRAPGGVDTSPEPTAARPTPGADSSRPADSATTVDRTAADANSRTESARPVEQFSPVAPGAGGGAAQETGPKVHSGRSRGPSSPSDETGRAQPAVDRSAAPPRDISSPAARVSDSKTTEEPRQPNSPGAGTPGRTPEPADPGGRSAEKPSRTSPSEPGSSLDLPPQEPKSSLDLPPLEPVRSTVAQDGEPPSPEHPVGEDAEHQTVDTSSTTTDPVVLEGGARQERTTEPTHPLFGLSLPDPVKGLESVQESESRPAPPTVEPQPPAPETRSHYSATAAVDRDRPDATNQGAASPVVDDIPVVAPSTSDADVDHGHDSGESEDNRNDSPRDSDSETPRESPREIERQYLSKVVDERVENPWQIPEYESAQPRFFVPGCDDKDLPDGLTRSMPERALDDSAQTIDPSKIYLGSPGSGHAVVWRDKSAGDAYLEPQNALFRMDSRGPEIFGQNFESKNPRRLCIDDHIGNAADDGFVSFGASPEAIITRDLNTIRSEVGAGKLTRFPDGTFRQTRYMHELYTPHGIDVDATQHDASARSRAYHNNSQKETEILAPGGIEGNSIYRIWPREVIVDGSGKVLSVEVGKPIYNPRFAHLDNSRFIETHDISESVSPQRDSTEQRPPATEAVSARSPELIDSGRASTDTSHVDPQPDPMRAPESTSSPRNESPTPPRHQEQVPNEQRGPVAPERDQQPRWMQGTSDSEAPRTFSQAPEVPRNDPQHAPDPGPRDPYASQDSDRRQSGPSTPRYSEPRQSNDRGAAERVEHGTPTRQDPHQPTPEQPEQIPPRQNSVPRPRHDSQQDLTQAPESSTPPQRVDASESARAHEDPRAQRGSGDRSYVERQDPARTSGPEQPGPHRGPQLSRPEDGPPRGPSREDLEAAHKARQSREWFRQWRPEGDRVTPVTSKLGPNAKPSFDFRRYPRAEGGPIAVARIKVHVTTDGRVHPDRVGQVWERAQLATDLEFNRAQRLLSGDRLLVDLEYTHNPAEANLHINVSEDRGPWHPDMSSGDIARQLRDHVGLLPSDPNHPGLSPVEIRQLSNDVAHANTPTPFDNPSELRTNGPQRLNDVERPEYQAAVEDALREGNRFLVGADPRTNGYGKLINDGGINVEGRSNNCLDCSLSALSAFQGHPQVSAPRWRDRLPDGTIDTQGGERGGVQRAAQWIGDGLHQLTDGRPLPAQFAGLHDIVDRMGPGSSALVVNEWHARDQVTGQLLYNTDGTPVRGGSHATVIVYPHGASGPVWWDPQAGTMFPHPPPDMAYGSTGLWFTPIPSPHQGGIHGGIPHPGPGRGVPSADLQSRPSVSAVPVRGRVAGPIDPHLGGERSRGGVGDDQSGDRLGNRRGDGIPELERDDDRGELPGGQTDRPAERQADLPTPVASERAAHSGDAGDDQLSRPGAVSGDSTGGERGVRDDNRQEYAEVPAARTGLGGPDRLGGVAEPRERGLAGTTDLGGVETQGSTASVAANHDIATSLDDPAANPQRDGGGTDGNSPPEPGARPDTPDGHGGDESATRQDAERYVSQNHVAEALDRADERGVVTKSGGPIGDAVRNELPEHPELVQLMQNTPYLEHSLLERPQTLHALVTRPDAIPFLSDAAHSVAERGPEAVLADPVRIEPTPLTPEQQAISRELQDSLRRVEPMDQRQPGFDRYRRLDPLYQREFLQHQYDIWESTQGELNRIVSDIAGRTNGKAGWRKQPKDPERARAKIKKYQGDVSRLTDLVGAKIEFDKIDDAYRALDLISADRRIEVVSFDDRFANPTASGYRDLQMKVRMPNGHIAEFRLHLSHVDKFVDTEHALFEVRRDFESLAEDEHRDDLRPEEKALRSEIDRQTNKVFWEATKKGLPDEFPHDPEHGPEDRGPEPDGPVPQPGPDGPPPKPAPDTRGVDHEAIGEANLRQSDSQYTHSDVPDTASGVRDRAEIERDASASVDRSVDRRIAYLKDDSGAKRFAPKAGRGIRSLLHSEFERLELSRRGLKDLVAHMVNEPGFDPAVVDAWRSDRPKLAIDISDESGKASRMVLIDRGPGSDPLLVPTGSSEHSVAVIERIAGEEGVDPVQLYHRHRFAVDDSTRDFGRISVGSSEDAMRIGTRIMRDLPLVEELRTELHSELAESVSRHLDRVPEQADSYFSERGFKPGKREIRDYEQRLAEEIRNNGKELRDKIDKLTKIGFDPHAYSAWRQARAAVTIEIKPDASRAVFTNAPPPRFRLIDLGGDRRPQLLPVGRPEHLLARIGELAEEGRDPAAILSALCERDNEKADFTAHSTDQQTLDLAREALSERRIAEDLDSMAKSGNLGSEVNEIRHRVGAELDHATTRWLDPFRRIGMPEMPGGVRADEMDTQRALLRLRSRATAAIHGGIDPEIYRLWSQNSPAIGVRSGGADSGGLVSLHDPTAEGGRRVLPARSGERELAMIERELRDGTYPPDAVRRLNALAETADVAPVIGRHAAEQSGSEVAEIEAINRHLQTSLDESVARAAHFEPNITDQNQRLTDQAANAVRRERQQAIEGAARDLRERISDRIGAGIDPAVYRAWQQARDEVPVTVRSGDHVERMTLLDLGPDREPLLVSSKSPEWELHRIEQMPHTDESLFAVHRELIGEDSEKLPPAIYRPFSEEDPNRQLYADSADEAVSVGREVLAQKQEAREEITAMQQRSLDAARHAMTSGELSPTEFAQRERQIRSDTQTLRDMADRLFAQGIDPRVVSEVRAMYDGKTEGMVSHHATPEGPPSVVVTIQREPHVREAGHDDQGTTQHDKGRQQAAREAQLSRLRAEAERRERVLLEQQKQARQREHELVEQHEQAAAREKERAEERARERREAQQRHQARQAEIARTRAARERAQHELAQLREGRAPEPRAQSGTRAPEHSPVREPERGIARGPEHGSVHEPERQSGREFDQPAVRKPERGGTREPDRIPVRELEPGPARGVERDRADILERHIMELADQEHQMVLEHQRDVGFEEVLDVQRQHERALFDPQQMARQQELALVREAISAHELELAQTRERLLEVGDELSRGQEPSHQALTPVPERQPVPVRGLPPSPVREPTVVEWKSPERQLGQLITLVKQVDAPTLAIKEVITPAKVHELLAQEMDCPAQYLERLARSPENLRWLARQREEQERMRSRAREMESNARAMVRTRD
ncbi:hypothetical protein ABIA39_003960 [Nocardia sp. GAS34]|uniref:toxin glutamine deamidase domain-containing protein n=1 Tax=unclassified Nocardia TaxID=2637762 RepID=UPI003D2288BF